MAKITKLIFELLAHTIFQVAGFIVAIFVVVILYKNGIVVGITTVIWVVVLPVIFFALLRKKNGSKNTENDD